MKVTTGMARAAFEKYRKSRGWDEEEVYPLVKDNVAYVQLLNSTEPAMFFVFDERGSHYRVIDVTVIDRESRPAAEWLSTQTPQNE